MSWFAGFRKVRVIFSLMVVLVAFLGLSASLLIMRQNDFLLDLEKAHAEKEMELVGTLAREALIKRDYTTVEQFLVSWGVDNPDIAAIEAVAQNGYTLALYERERDAAKTFEVSHKLSFSGDNVIFIKAVKDFSAVDKRVKKLLVQGAAALVAFTMAMGSALWFTLRRTAILPMENLVLEVQELNEGLEERVQERTADLVTANEALKHEMSERGRAEEGLRASKKVLERQNEELKKLDMLKDSLIRDISHELKTPVAKHLMQIEILADMMMEKGTFDSVKDVVEVMERGIRRQEAAIRNILLMSRLEEGGRKTVAAPFRLDALMEEVVNDYMHGIASYGIQLNLELDPLTVVADRELLWHVFANLISNSIKYRNPSNPHLQVRCEKRGDDVLVQVGDNGAGFSREDREKAFDRFYQSSPSTEGVGLGLNISKTITEKLGGSIRIDSEGRNQGTIISVILPAERGDGRKAHARLAEEST